MTPADDFDRLLDACHTVIDCWNRDDCPNDDPYLGSAILHLEHTLTELGLETPT